MKILRYTLEDFGPWVDWPGAIMRVCPFREHRCSLSPLATGRRRQGRAHGPRRAVTARFWSSNVVSILGEAVAVNARRDEGEIGV